MCGRYVRTLRSLDYVEPLMTDEGDPRLRNIRPAEEELPPSWNIAPSQEEVIMGYHDGEAMWAKLEWGYRPKWSTEGPRQINARSETADSKPYFRDAWKYRRVLLPADGWYEWQKVGGKKVPYFIYPADKTPMFFAGLADGNGGFCILTREPAGALAEIHDRCPVVLQGEGAIQWLSCGKTKEAPRAVLDQHTVPDEAFAWHQVGPTVGSPFNNGPGLVDPFQDPRERSGPEPD